MLRGGRGKGAYDYPRPRSVEDGAIFAKIRRSTHVSAEQSEQLRVVCASFRKSKSYFINGKWQCESKSESFEREALF